MQARPEDGLRLLPRREPGREPAHAGARDPGAAEARHEPRALREDERPHAPAQEAAERNSGQPTGRMKVGIFLTNQQPVGSDMVAALEGQLAMTRLARDRGWDAVATGQHYLSEGVSQLQLVPFLARLAAEAGEMTSIAGVLLAGLHNPVEVAECIA